MKLHSSHSKYLYSLSALQITVTIVLVWWAFPAINYLYDINWLFIALLAGIFISPLGSIKLKGKIKLGEELKYNKKNWLSRIAGLQICLWLVFYGITHVIASALGKTDNRLIIASIQQHQQLALLPWNMILIMAISMGLCAYCQKQDGFLGNLLLPIFQSKPHQGWWSAFNAFAKQATIVVLAISFTFMSLLIVNFFTPIQHIIPTGFNATNFILTIILIIFCFTKYFKLLLEKLLSRKIYLPIALFITTVLLASVLIALNYLLLGLSHTFMPPPAIIKKFQAYHWKNLWLLFSAAWWVAWTPLIGAYIAKISKGYSLRAILLATFTLPIIFNLITLTPIHFTLPSIVLLPSYIISLLAFLGLLLLLCNPYNLPMVILSYLPKSNQLKHRDHHFFFRRVWQIVMLTLYLYLPIGLAGASFLLFSATLALCILAFFVAIALIKQLRNLM